MSNGKRLMILLTESEHDLPSLKEMEGWPGSAVVYVDCDTPAPTAEPNPVLRLLAVINTRNQRKQENTARVNAVLSQVTEHDTVVGIHTTQLVSNTIDPTQLARKVPVTAYTTNKYPFVKKWCKHLAEARPDISEIGAQYDQLFGILKDVSAALYEILYAFLPLHIELQFEDGQEQTELVLALQRHAEDLRSRMADALSTATTLAEANKAKEALNSVLGHIESISENAVIDFAKFHADYCFLRDCILEVLGEIDRVRA